MRKQHEGRVHGLSGTQSALAGREWQQEPAASGHIMPLARKQGAESEQKVEPNHKIPRPHLPAPVTPFCQWGSSSSSSIAFAKGRRLAGAHDPGETGVPALSVL